MVPDSGAGRRPGSGFPSCSLFLPGVLLEALTDWHNMPMTIQDADMATRNVVLTDRQEDLIDTLVEGGRYQNASEVLREGLRLLEQREAEDAAKLVALREAAKQGMASIEAGRFRRFENPADLDRHLRALAKRTISAAKRD